MTFVYLDTETTGLDPQIHQVWEIAYAIDDGPIEHAFVPHQLVSAAPDALEIGGYYRRCDRGSVNVWFDEDAAGVLFERTIVGANPAFDTAFLRQRWGKAPWKYRLIDIETYAMPAMQLDEPAGLNTIAGNLIARGYDIPIPDHTAAGDVRTVRACHLALRDIYDHRNGPKAIASHRVQ